MPKVKSKKMDKKMRGRPKAKGMKKPGPPRKDNYRTKYTEALLAEAMEEVTAGRMTAREASKQFNVPRHCY